MTKFKRPIERWSKITAILFFFAAFSSCKKEEIEEQKPEPVLSTTKAISSFSFKVSKNPSLISDVTGEIKGDTIFASTLAGTDISNLVPEFTYEGVKVTVADVEQKSTVTPHDFTSLQSYQITAEDNSKKTYTVKFIDNGIPVLYISTNGVAVNSKDNYVAGTVKFVSNFREVAYEGKTEIKGRGNSTWGMPKKPYRLKLDKKAGLLGMSEGKNWVLLANYADKSLMRNELAFMLSRKSKLAFTPDSRYIEVYLNNEYQGNYLMTEQIKEGKDLVDVEDGGYLLEEDGFANSEPVYFVTDKGMPITIKYPDDKITAEQKTFIKGHFQKFEDALFSDNFADPVNGYRKYFDLDTYVDYYIVNEVMGNSDIFWSTYMYKKKNDDKIYTGPVWDFDIAANNDERLGNQVNGLMFNSAHQPKMWIDRLMQDPTFRQKIRSRWNEIYNDVKTLPSSVDALALKLALSQKKNFRKWDILSVKVYLELQVAGSYNGEVQYLRNHLTNHISWLNTTFNSSDYQ